MPRGGLQAKQYHQLLAPNGVAAIARRAGQLDNPFKSRANYNALHFSLDPHSAFAVLSRHMCARLDGTGRTSCAAITSSEASGIWRTGKDTSTQSVLHFTTLEKYRGT